MFNVSGEYTKSDKYPPREILQMLCDKAFSSNAITLFYMQNERIKEFDENTSKSLLSFT